MLAEQDWQIRHFIYEFFVDKSRPPSTAETAERFEIGEPDARAAYHRLNDAHAFFLDPGTDDIRIANPLSAVPTGYRVRVQGRDLYANCAWDSLGIPAMLAADAEVIATIYGVAEPVSYGIREGQLYGQDGLVHFAVPFSHWYDDLIHT